MPGIGARAAGVGIRNDPGYRLWRFRDDEEEAIIRVWMIPIAVSLDLSIIASASAPKQSRPITDRHGAFSGSR